MSYLNALMRGLFDILLAPFRSLPPLVGVLIVSFVTAIGMLLVFKKTSNQEKLAAVKNKINACLFEIRLFNDDILAILRAQNEILRHNLTYLRLSLVPTLYMIVPLVLVIAQLEFHYGYKGLQPGQAFLVKVKLSEAATDALMPTEETQDDGATLRPDVSLELPSGLVSETPPVWIPDLGEIDWRLRAQDWGDYDLNVKMNGQSFTKTVQVSNQVRRRSPERLEGTFLNELIYPAEEPLPKGAPVTSIAVGYAGGDISIFGWGVNWMILFFILSIAIAFALKGKFGVTM